MPIHKEADPIYQADQWITELVSELYRIDQAVQQMQNQLSLLTGKGGLIECLTKKLNESESS